MKECITEKILEKNMINRIEIISKITDTRAVVKKNFFQSLPAGKKVKDAHIADVYTIDKNLQDAQLKKITSILSNPVIHETLSPKFSFNWAIEIGFLPGVTDNLGTIAKESIEDALGISFSQNEDVYSSQIFFIQGALSKKEIETLAYSLANPLIQRIHIKNHEPYVKDKGMDRIAPRVILPEIKDAVVEISLDVDDKKLQNIGKLGIQNPDGSRRGPLALDLLYMKTIKAYFKKLKRNPTDIELESLAQTWSEHCKHTIFADPMDTIKDGLFRHYIKRATEEIREKLGNDDFCASVFTDNSGAIVFDKDFLITHKMETHNSPSALDPFGGALTGIVGANRDAIGFGLGAKPVANIYGFCVGKPDSKTILYRDKDRKDQILSPKRILQGVVQGVNAGGNCSGIPTPLGFLLFDDRYQGKPLVFAGTVGLIPQKISRKKGYEKKAMPGDYIVMIGGRVGVDGIHGATFSSEALTAGSPATAVQIGDPITQKKFSDAIVKEARNLGLFNSITDNGAGGLSSSVGEMAKESGGCFVRLNHVPLKYPGMKPWQIWISESQERMTLAVPKDKWKQLEKLLRMRGVEATIIGEFTDSGKCVVEYKNNIIMDIDLAFLHNGLPKRPMKTKKPVTSSFHLRGGTQNLLSMLSDYNFASYDFISQQYDHDVQGGSVLKPLQGKGRVNADATVIRPVLTSQKGVVLSYGLHPFYGDTNTYRMAAYAIDTAIRNAVAAGANPKRLALLDNFCWCDSTNPERLYQLKKAAEACYDYAVAYGTPFISGKDSMFNDFKGYDAQGKPVFISIPPTLLISSIGVIDDVSKTVSLDVKFPGDLIYIVGDASGESPEKNKKIYDLYHQCVLKEIIASAISVSRGGIAIALAKTAIGGMLGVDVSLDTDSLFLESQGKMIVTINPNNKTVFENTMKHSDFIHIGTVTEKPDVIIRDLHNKIIIQTTVHTMFEHYKKTLKGY